MDRRQLKGKVQTVLGIIDPQSLGITLMHEHLLTDLSVFFVEPKEATLREIAHQPLSLENLYMVRYNAPSNIDNCKYTDEDLMTKEAMRFKIAGGGSIVEMSNTGLYGDPVGLTRISRATGLNIIRGGGFYIGKSQDESVLAMDEESLAAQILEEITVGFTSVCNGYKYNTGVKAGLIGEIGCNSPFEDFEKKSLRAAAIAQQETGALINIHPSHEYDLVLENVKVLKEARADLSRVVVSHCDGWGFSKEVIFKLLDQGCVVEFDTFGFEGIYTYYWGHHINMMTDEDRIKSIMEIIKRGFIKQLVIASDHCFKHLLASYGGGGFDHIIRNDFLLMKTNGMTESEINEITVENPRRLLAFV